MAKVKGNAILLEVGGNAYIGTTTKSAEFARDMIDSTTKDSQEYKEYVPGERGLTLTVEGLHDIDNSTESGEKASQDLIDGNLLAFKWGAFSESGDRYIDGNAYISSVSINGPKNEMASYTVNLQVTGVFSWDEVV